MIPFDTSIISIHMHNHTQTSREGFMCEADYRDLPTLILNPLPDLGYSDFTNLQPGMYKFSANGNEYAIMLHDHYYGADHLVIRSQSDLFGIVNAAKVTMIPYKLNVWNSYPSSGIGLQHTCNDHIELMSLHGSSSYLRNEDSFSASHMSMAHVSVTKPDGSEKCYLLNLKKYLKGLAGTNGLVYDRVFIDFAHSIATFQFNTGIFRFSGNENEIQKLSDDYGLYTFQLPNYKPGSRFFCTHFDFVDYEQYHSITTNSIVYRDSQLVLQSPENDLIGWLRQKAMFGDPVTIVYEYQEPRYESVYLNNSNIDLAFNSCIVKVNRCNSVRNLSVEDSNDFIIPIDDYVTVDLGVEVATMYFYKCFKGLRG